jgi:hypothetical protein
MPMESVTWLALIPVVLIERFLFAGGMVLMHKGISWMMSASWIAHKKRVVSAA